MTTTPRTQSGSDDRTSRNRDATEQKMLSAARLILKRDGVLAGLSLIQVAKEAGVNRGLIYQYFGSRQSLIRVALNQQLERYRRNTPPEFWKLDFVSRLLGTMSRFAKQPDFIPLHALLCLDGDPEFRVLPSIAHVSEAIRRDEENDYFVEGIDGTAANVATISTVLGYAMFRQAFAREFHVNQDELDEKVLTVFEAMLTGLRRAGSD